MPTSVPGYTVSMKKLLGILVLGLLWCNTSFAEREDFYACKHRDGSVWNIKILDKHFVWSYGTDKEVTTKILSEDSEKIVINDEPGDRSIFFKKNNTLLVVMQPLDDTYSCRKLN